jgi:2-methylcitrate dehydratase PrpD
MTGLASASDPLGELLDWATRLRYEDLPDGVVHAAKRVLLNTIAATLAGSSAPGAREAVRRAEDWGGRPTSTVAVFGLKTSAPLAAFANGVMAHAMDFDDTQASTGFHPSVSLLPALLAVSQIGDASGKGLLTSFVAGLEIGCRMTLAATNRAAHPWLTTTLFGPLGAVIGAGCLLGIDPVQLRHAVGIAYSSVGGNRQGLLEGALIQRVQPGLSAQAAVAAVQLAQDGLTGAHDVLEGRYGLYPSHYGEDYRRETLTKALGHDYELRGIGMKAYPCCSYSQEPVEAACELARAPGFDVGGLAEVRAWVGTKHAAGLVDRPYTPRACPQVVAQFSLQYVIAASLRTHALTLLHFQDSALHDPELIALAARVRVLIDPAKEGTVELVTHDGQVRSCRVRVARGHPSLPLSDSELRAKLDECAQAAARPVSAEYLAQLVQGLENCPRASDLAEAMASPQDARQPTTLRATR